MSQEDTRAHTQSQAQEGSAQEERLERRNVTITTLGSSDAFNSGGRGNSCFFVRDEVGAYAVDFGPTAPLIARREGIDLGELDAIFLTHLHGDHVNGLPSLLIDLTFLAPRERPLTIAGPTGTREHIARLCALSYPGVLPERLPFELHFVEWARRSSQEIVGRKLTSYPAQHDPHVMPCCLRLEALTPNARALAFSGDTGWCASLIEVSEGADVLVCECSYASYVFDGHLSLEELKTHRASLKVARLILTHFGEEARAAALAEPSPLFEVADDGVIFELSST
jgi:ribonuclease BN (tRNA processing enzyme)